MSKKITPFEKAKIAQINELVKLQKKRGLVEQLVDSADSTYVLVDPVKMTPAEKKEMKEKSKLIAGIEASQAMIKDSIEQTPNSKKEVAQAVSNLEQEIKPLTAIEGVNDLGQFVGKNETQIIEPVLQTLKQLKFPKSQLITMKTILEANTPPTKGQLETVKRMQKRLTKIEESIPVGDSGQSSSYDTLRNSVIPFLQQLFTTIISAYKTNNTQNQDDSTDLNLEERLAKLKIDDNQAFSPRWNDNRLEDFLANKIDDNKPLQDDDNDDKINQALKNIDKKYEAPPPPPMPPKSSPAKWKETIQQGFAKPEIVNYESPETGEKKIFVYVPNPETDKKVLIGSSDYTKLQEKYKTNPDGTFNYTTREVARNKKARLDKSKENSNALSTHAMTLRDIVTKKDESLKATNSKAAEDIKQEKLKRVGKSKSQTGTGTGANDYKIKPDGSFGQLKFDMKAFKQMKLIVRRGSKIVAKGPLSYDLHELLTKRFNPRNKYSQETLNTFKKLVDLAGLPKIGGKHNKTAILEGRLTAKNEELPTSTKKFVYYHNMDELTQRLHLLLGSIDNGNSNPALKEEASQILDILKQNEVITPVQYETVLQSFTK